MGLLNNAKRLIETHGQPATLLRAGEGETDEYGTYTPGLDIEHPVTVFLARYAFDLQPHADGFQTYGKHHVFISDEGLDIQPRTTDRLRINGTVHEIRQAEPFVYRGQTVFWEVEPRDV